MKRIYGVKKNYHRLVVKASRDYFGDDTDVKNVVHAITGSKVSLSDEEKHAVFCIKANLQDKQYTDSLVLG